MKGQSFLETLTVVSCMLIIALFLSVVLLRSFASILLTSWAAKQSRCAVVEKNPTVCAFDSKLQLQKYFSFRDVNVETKFLSGVIHSEIRARLLGQTLVSGSYDLGPSEYKRVSR